MERQNFEEIRHTVDKSKDLLYIRLFKYSAFPRKFKQKRIFISDERIGTYKIDVPFTVKKEIIGEWTDHTHFHNDSTYTEREVEVKEYSEPDLTNFINAKVLLHKK